MGTQGCPKGSRHCKPYVPPQRDLRLVFRFRSGNGERSRPARLTAGSIWIDAKRMYRLPNQRERRRLAPLSPLGRLS